MAAGKEGVALVSGGDIWDDGSGREVGRRMKGEGMSLKDLYVAARSYRRFEQARDVDVETLVAAVDAARLVPSSINFQPMRYAVSVNREMNARIFEHLIWARALKDWGGPKEGERPAGYIVIGGDINFPQHHMVDLGIACMSVFLCLAEAGLAACMIGSINAKRIHEIVGFPEEVKVLQVMAVGYPGETVVLEDLQPGAATTYYRDAQDHHHVPKRLLDDVLLAKFV